MTENTSETVLLTAKEVAGSLRLPVSTVYHLAKTKELPSVRIGRALRFPRLEIEALLSGEAAKGEILIIDDDVTVLCFLGAALQQAGYQTQTTTSIADARAHLAGDSFDLLLVDVMLPDGSGVKLIDELHPVYGNDRVILMTSYADLPELNELLSRVPLTLLKKPVDLNQLLECVNGRFSGISRGARHDGCVCVGR